MKWKSTFNRFLKFSTFPYSVKFYILRGHLVWKTLGKQDSFKFKNYKVQAEILFVLTRATSCDRNWYKNNIYNLNIYNYILQKNWGSVEIGGRGTDISEIIIY